MKRELEELIIKDLESRRKIRKTIFWILGVVAACYVGSLLLGVVGVLWECVRPSVVQWSNRQGAFVHISIGVGIGLFLLAVAHVGWALLQGAYYSLRDF
jgi:hypothetical protein